MGSSQGLMVKLIRETRGNTLKGMSVTIGNQLSTPITHIQDLSQITVSKHLFFKPVSSPLSQD